MLQTTETSNTVQGAESKKLANDVMAAKRSEPCRTQLMKDNSGSFSLAAGMWLSSRLAVVMTTHRHATGKAAPCEHDFIIALRNGTAEQDNDAWDGDDDDETAARHSSAASPSLASLSLLPPVSSQAAYINWCAYCCSPAWRHLFPLPPIPPLLRMSSTPRHITATCQTSCRVSK